MPAFASLTDSGSPVVCTYLPTGQVDRYDHALAVGRRTWPLVEAPANDQRHLLSPSPLTTGRLTLGGLIVLAHRGPNARTAKNGWCSATLRHLALGVITAVEHDEHGLNVSFGGFFRADDVPGAHLGGAVMEALRLSANNWGRPVTASAWPTLGLLARLVAHHPDLPPAGSAHGELVAMIARRATGRLHGEQVLP
ncbi:MULTISPECIES: hypothetical protein [Actinosynnema]|uniref:hypothetical protein n=1 Tax=Actinosynnema TaxID=40566 RepID=UPI0020A53F5F|nr:hypothetical protein [Actinosynnema pretiosum]MCP2095560.1 hypothetical protein [Actinosynnema pretiosum]